MAEKLDWIRDLAAAEGRTLRFGIRLHVISRDTAARPGPKPASCSSYLDPAEVANAQQELAESESDRPAADA